ncbi:MAG: zf-TFIIB domain-containing protein [Myxococcales bacterium]|nr:zf-TFIIB domain-containing protein [Myxococcales bacterium]
MYCPRCDKPLVPSAWDDLDGASPYRAQLSAAFDRMRCNECRGSWVPVQSVGALVQSIAEPMVGREKAQLVARRFDADTEAMDVAESLKIRCPRCRAPMDKLRSRVRFLVLYDRCGACRGMWFDEGELPRIVSALHTSALNTLDGS